MSAKTELNLDFSQDPELAKSARAGLGARVLLKRSLAVCTEQHNASTADIEEGQDPLLHLGVFPFDQIRMVRFSIGEGEKSAVLLCDDHFTYGFNADTLTNHDAKSKDSFKAQMVILQSPRGTTILNTLGIPSFEASV